MAEDIEKLGHAAFDNGDFEQALNLCVDPENVTMSTGKVAAHTNLENFTGAVNGSEEGRGNTDSLLCQSLLNLYDVADNVFNNILSRVKMEQEKLNNLTARISDREAQIAAFAGTKEAITLFSSAKYLQVPTDQTDFVPVFGGKQSELPIATISLAACQHQDGEGGTLELFRFFSETNHEYWSRQTQSADGLGRVPKDIKSVADCMLFNSLELPYHLYRVVDNLTGADIVVGEEEPKHKPPPLAAPPQSVLAGDTLSSSGVQEYGFRPMLGEVPSFSLPSTLPNLPMVADISWSGSSRQFQSIPLISPSVGHYRNASFGDSSVEGTPTKSDTKSLDSSTRGFEDVMAAASSRLSLPQHPSPLLTESGTFPADVRSMHLPKLQASQTSDFRLPTIVTKTKSAQDVPRSVSQTIPAVPSPPPPRPPPPPPPPPPPLPPLRSPTQPAQIKTSTTSSSERPDSSTQLEAVGPRILPLPIDASRAALLASIRNPSIQLRKTNVGDKPTTSTDKSQSSSGKQVDSNRPKTVNVLTEMANTLKLRRLSMQGAAHDKSQAKPSKILGNEDTDAGSVSSGSNSTGITLPIKNLHDYIASRNQEVSDDDDWEE